MNSGKVKIQLIVDDKGTVKVKQFGQTTEKSVKKAGKSVEKADKQTQRWLRSWKGMGLIAGAATAVIAYKLQRLAKEFIGLANVQEAVETRMAAVIKSTGQAAGFNVAQMTEMASAYQGLTTIGDEVILSGQAILATFKKIRGEGFERAAMAALDMSEVMQTDLKSSIVMIGKAMNDPIANLSAMTRAGVQFTEAQKDMIKELWGAGKTMEAQNIILQELESQFGGAAKAARENFGGATKAAGNALGDMKEELGFVITKNQIFIELAHLAEKQFMAWGETIKNNREYLMDLAKDGLLRVADGIVFTIETMRFFHNAWLGIKLVGTTALHLIAVSIEEVMGGLRVLLTPLDLIFQGMVKLGVLEANPFDAMAAGLNQFSASSGDVVLNVLADIEKTNAAYDTLVNKIKQVREAIEQIPVAAAEAATAEIAQIENTNQEKIALEEAMQEKIQELAEEELYWREEHYDNLMLLHSQKHGAINEQFIALQEEHLGYLEEANLNEIELIEKRGKDEIKSIQDRYKKILKETRFSEAQEAKIKKMMGAQIAATERKIGEEMNKTRRQQLSDAFSMTAKNFRDIAELGGEFGRTGFRMYQAFAIAETTMSTYEGAQKVFTALAAWPPAAHAAAAAATLAGLARVGMILKQDVPSYDEGGISKTPGIYYAAVPEAHIPLKSGAVPVEIKQPIEQSPIVIYSHIHVEMDGQELSDFVVEQIYDRTKDGDQVVHTRGITDI